LTILKVFIATRKRDMNEEEIEDKIRMLDDARRILPKDST